jgi:hypothetical protein
MPIDSSIAMGYQPIKLENPMNSLAQLMQMEGARNQNRLADLQFQQHEQTQTDNKNLNALYAKFTKPDGTIDEAGLIQGAAQGNMGSKIPGFRKQFAETAEAKGKLDKQNIELVDAKLKQSRGFLDGVTTPEQYIAWHEGNHKDPILGPMLASRGVTAEQSRAKIAQALQTPGGLEKLIAESKLGSEKFMELNKPSYQTQNTGDKTSIIALPGLGGAPTTVSSSTINQSAQSKAEIAARADEAAKGRAVTIRGQDLTNARAKDANTLKAGEKKATDDLTKGSQIASFDTMLGTLDRLGQHPGLSRSVGKMSVFPTMPGSDSANFQAELNTFQSQAFIPMVAQLKGMGALSDAEGKKLTQAVGALDPKMGEQAFRDSITRIKADMESAYARVAGKPREGGATGDFSGNVVDFRSLK